MDEAERCHEIAYIAYGELLAHGTVEAVIAQSKLTTYAVTGSGLVELAVELEKQPGVDSVAPFGTSLHVSGRDRTALEAVIAAHRDAPALAWKEIEPSLEDVFIGLMAKAKDNMQ
jgi:ABC-2 type transport system ATP-binding protein